MKILLFAQIFMSTKNAQLEAYHLYRRMKSKKQIIKILILLSTLVQLLLA